MDYTFTPEFANFLIITYSVVVLTDLVAYLMIFTSNPYLLASSAVFPTQKSNASPQTNTSLASNYSNFFLSNISLPFSKKPL
jgi:hypothetical protein